MAYQSPPPYPRIIDDLPTDKRVLLFEALRDAYGSIRDTLNPGMPSFDIIEEIVNAAEFCEDHPTADAIVQDLIERYGYKMVFKQLSLTFSFR